jgi:hypothetical protein
MIDEEKTFEKYGYRSTDLSYGSGKHIVMVCKLCGKDYDVRKAFSETSKYCSKKCFHDASSGENSAHWKGGKQSRVCAWCGQEFFEYPSRSEQRFCSRACSGMWKSKYLVGENSPAWAGGDVSKICKMCGKEYFVKNSQLLVSNFCSRECMWDYAANNYSGENSPCYKQKIVKMCEQCGKEYEIDEYAADDSRFCSRECMDGWRSESIIGKDNPNWNGGISFLPYCPKFDEKFKEKIRNDFGRMCFVCGKTEICNKRNLSVHHTTYDKDAMCDDSKSDFVPLCSRCHTITNFNRRFWEKLFTYALQYYDGYYNVCIPKPLLLLET